MERKLSITLLLFTGGSVLTILPSAIYKSMPWPPGDKIHVVVAVIFLGSSTKKRARWPPFLLPNCNQHDKMQLFAKFKKIMRRRFRATLNFRKFKVALNSLRKCFSNFAKSCILSCWLQFGNKKWESPSSLLSYKRLKLNLRVFLAGYIVAMVSYCATKLTATCSPLIGQFVDAMILASTGIERL